MARASHVSPLMPGRLIVRRAGQFQFLPDDPDLRPYLVDEHGTGGAVHEDRVLARARRRHGAGGVPYATIEKVVERTNRQWVGVVRRGDGFFLEPNDKRFPLMLLDGSQPGAAGRTVPSLALEPLSGQTVVAAVSAYPQKPLGPVHGQVVEVLGRQGTPGLDIAVVARSHGLPLSFPPAVLAAAASAPQEVMAEQLAGRLDLRGGASEVTVFTIDGEDAKDLDDAVSVEDLGDGRTRLGVHIADVSHYVTEGTVLDKEAAHRTTSVYLVDRVLPMLPPALSNGICSLNPSVDRLTVSVFMEFDAQGRRERYTFARSVIQSAARLTYKQVAASLGAWTPPRPEDTPPPLPDIGPAAIGTPGGAGKSGLQTDLERARDLATKLRSRRLERGAIDFDFPEDKVLLDAAGRPTAIRRYERTIADQIIEEFMLAANETVAEYLQWAEVPAVYRVHEQPTPAKMKELQASLRELGFAKVRIPPERVHPSVIQNILEQVRGTRDGRLVQNMLLRSLQKARYAARPLGHFALAARHYCHFTSPIRRYPDLLVHRVLTEVLTVGRPHPKKLTRWQETFPDLADHCSAGERTADEAELESVDVKKVEFIEPFLGEEFGGVVTGVEPFGLFVEMENLVEGLVHVSALHDDYYLYDAPRHRLVGELTKRTFRVGQTVRVRLVRVNVEDRLIDLELVPS